MTHDCDLYAITTFAEDTRYCLVCDTGDDVWDSEALANL